MTDRPAGDEPAEEQWKAGWEDQEDNALTASLAATPAQRLEWLEEAIELAWAAGALPTDHDPDRARELDVPVKRD